MGTESGSETQMSTALETTIYATVGLLNERLDTQRSMIVDLLGRVEDLTSRIKKLEDNHGN